MRSLMLQRYFFSMRLCTLRLLGSSGELGSEDGGEAGGLSSIENLGLVSEKKKSVIHYTMSHSIVVFKSVTPLPMKKSEESRAWEEEVLMRLPLLVLLPATVMDGGTELVSTAGEACGEANLDSKQHISEVTFTYNKGHSVTLI